MDPIYTEAADAIAALRAELADRDKRLADLKRPTHGPCCTCQRCGKSYDDCRCDLDEVVAELAAERERCERYNVLAGQDADELARLRQSEAALAAALERATAALAFADTPEGCMVSYKELLDELMDPTAILASVKAAQRRKGAAWALREVAIHCAVSEMGPDVSYGLSNALTLKADAIESGEGEVPND